MDIICEGEPLSVLFACFVSSVDICTKACLSVATLFSGSYSSMKNVYNEILLLCAVCSYIAFISYTTSKETVPLNAIQIQRVEAVYVEFLTNTYRWFLRRAFLLEPFLYFQCPCNASPYCCLNGLHAFHQALV